tara:strand:+ start:226 stop:2259 length:2034 start_codon:yes stop_codon:yes gene_type:complete
VFIFTSLGDIGQPYSCYQWGTQGSSGMPLITDDTGLPLFNLFNTENLLPSVVLIDHNMKVYHQEAGWNSSIAEIKIEEMLDNLQNTLILGTYMDYNILTNLGDNDGVLNPGESFNLDFNISNNSFYLDASNITVSITDDSNVDFNVNEFNLGNLNVNDNLDFSIIGSVEEDAVLDVHNYDVLITSSFIDLDGNSQIFEKVFSFDIDVNLFQNNFPFDIDSEVRSSPVIADFNNDGDNEIVLADYGGFVRIYNDGYEVENNNFPYDVGDQIWGSVASADLDLDGFLDFVVTSKSGYIYVFDFNGLKYSYNADRWLIASPVLGNIDNDEDLEIIVGGYQGPTSSSPLFAINYDGTVVDGFPYIIGEKIKSGVAVADMNDNGVDDIIFGTDDDNLYVLLDNLTIAPGFPINLGDKIQSEPSVLDLGNEKIIFTGNKDNNFYAINYSDASIRFVIPTEDDVFTSASFKQSLNGVEIYFGSDDGSIYGIDIYGNLIDGFPISLSSGGIVGSIVFADLDNDQNLDLIAADDAGMIFAYNENGNSLPSFPISYQFPFSSSPMIIDYDFDGDLEIVCGSTGDLVVIDNKDLVDSNIDSWTIFKGNYERNGFYESSGMEWDCPVADNGDINCDSIINILDIVTLVNIVVLGEQGFSEYELWSSDINLDGIINILDIVLLVNVVVSG